MGLASAWCEGSCKRPLALGRLALTCLDPLLPSQALNQPKIRSPTIARPAFLLDILEFWAIEILMGAPTVIDRADLNVREICTRVGAPTTPHQGLNLEHLQNCKWLIRNGRGERI
jgi:hypothetical protein